MGKSNFLNDAKNTVKSHTTDRLADIGQRKTRYINRCQNGRISIIVIS